MEPFHTELLSVPKRVHLESRSSLEPYPMSSCELPERFSSGTLRNEARGNLTQGNLKKGNLLPQGFYHSVDLLYRTVPRHHMSGKPIHTYTEQFQIEPFQSPRVNVAKMDPGIKGETCTFCIISNSSLTSVQSKRFAPSLPVSCSSV